MLLAGALPAMPWVRAAAIPDEFRIREGAGERTFSVARDEVGLRDQRGRWRAEKTAKAASADEVRSAVRRRRVSGRETADLVLYEKSAVPNDGSRRWLTGRVVVQLDGGANAETIRRQSGAAVLQRLAFAPGIVLFSAPDDPGASILLTMRLRALAGVRSADPLLARQHLHRLEPNDPLFADHPGNAGYQWHLRNTGARGGVAGIDANITPAWDRWRGSGVTLGIVDDGVQLGHPDLAANAAFEKSFDFNENDDDPSPGESDFHGTACAGVAAGRAGNGIGISGAAPESRVAALRLIAGPSSDMQDAEVFLHRSDVIAIKSNSWGPSDTGATIAGPGIISAAALRHATAFGRDGRGTIFVWAAGNGRSMNDNSNFDGWANSIYAIGVSAVGDNGRVAFYAEPGANVLVCAPSNGVGQGVTTVDLAGPAGYNTGSSSSNYAWGDYTNNFGGTSSACPLVAGIAALMIEANPALSWRDVQEILIRTAVKNDAGDSGWSTNAAGFHFNHKYGAGLINAGAAVGLAEGWLSLSAMESRSVAVSGLPLDIPDNDPAGVNLSFAVDPWDDLRVEHASLEVDIAHGSRGQLEISLTSPGGTTSQLATSRPDANSDLHWTFSTTHNWGEAAAGDWNVRIVDRIAGTVGRINSLRLILDGSVPSPSFAPVLTGPLSASASAGAPFAYQIEVLHGAVSFAAEGLPEGLTLDTATGRITGSAAAPGQHLVELAAINAVGTGHATLLLDITASVAAALARALDAPWLAFSVDFAHAWAVDTSTVHTGNQAVRSPALDNLSASAFSSQVLGPATVSFWWKVSSEPDFDFLRVFVDGIERAKIGGEVDWTLVTLGIPAGDHEVKWEYRKDDFSASGEDAGWVDGVDVRAAAGLAPVFVNVPAPFAAVEGARGIFWVEAIGQEPLSYLWEKVGQPLGGPSVSEPALIFSPVIAEDAGIYTVTVSNSLGSVTSPAVSLHVTTAAISGALGAALESPDLPWASRAVAAQPWQTENTTTFDGIDAARSGSVFNGGASSLHTLIEGPGVLSFHWKVSSTLNYDFLQFRVDNGRTRQISGTPFWQPVVTPLGTGLHTVAWNYVKDVEQAQGTDAGYLDAVMFEPTRFASWRSLKFSASDLAAPHIAGPHDDPDGDGFDNFLEYALNRQPLEMEFESATALLPLQLTSLTDATGAFFTVTFPRRIDFAARGLDYQLLVNSNLAIGGWSVPPLDVIKILPAPQPAIELVTARLPDAPQGWANRWFIRLLVTEN